MSTLTDQNKAISLFQFICELNKQNAIINIEKYPWKIFLSELPDDTDNISVYYRDRFEDKADDQSESTDNTLLSVHKPEFQKCPKPDAVFEEWLMPWWDDFHAEADVREQISTVIDEENEICELFTDDAKRVKSYKAWIAVRNEWASKQKITEQTRELFADMYNAYFELRRESETEEIIAANGMLIDAENTAICHPVLTHRVKMEFDAVNNTVSIVDTDVSSELYTSVFQVMNDIKQESINGLIEELQNNDYHPLDRNNTPLFLKSLVQQLSSDSIYSKKPLTPKERANNRLGLYLAPCFVVRKRLDGTVKAIERIIEDVEKTDKIPQPIRDIVAGGKIDVPNDTGEVPIEERLAAVGGESIDILLSKEANKEQLDIARRIETYNAVVVQGPPGTGKTHTIANLMGHFIANGKSVLVTSHTQKALRVLKEKIVPGLQNLCVSVLDDSNVDMERSVDGITSYMSKTTSFAVKREMETLAGERHDVINKLADVRKKIFAAINQEYKSIVINGKDLSPSEAAAFVVEHTEDLSYIPGNVKLGESLTYRQLPLTFDQLSDLYRSNEAISADDEHELDAALPAPDCIMLPCNFISVCVQLTNAIQQLNNIQNSCTFKITGTAKSIHIKGNFGEITMPYPALDAVNDLKEYAVAFRNIDKWQKAVAVDGKNNSAYRKRWEILIDNIKQTCECAEKFITHSLGKQLCIDSSAVLGDIKTTFEDMQPIFAKKGKLGTFDRWLHSNYEPAINAVTISGKHPSSADDCRLVIEYIELHTSRQQCGDIWNELMLPHGVSAFAELPANEPERIAHNYIPQIKQYLDWYATDYAVVIKKLSAVGIPSDVVFQRNINDSEFAATDKIFTCVQDIIPKICNACILIMESAKCQELLNSQIAVLTAGKRGNSSICKELVCAVNDCDGAAYSEAYASLEKMYEKYELQKKRDEFLKTLEPVAPQWAEAIQKRQGIHGSYTVPSNIEDAWKWKQLNGIIKELTEKPFEELQKESLELSRKYREVTALYAEKSGWYHLLKRTEADLDMKQALQGWRQMVKLIGKGTGKNAPKFRAQVRVLMAKCQNAVPGWIMPINKALENLDPRSNTFDIIIIDEASQADISSLAILYMGRKLIIVGDDKQVSPMAVGVNVNNVNALQAQYIQGKIPNWPLYNATTSIYDIAQTTFQPLMLKEHFRCVPEIIGFSNMLSYDWKIKPLRDASNSMLLPAVVNYRVTDGKRLGNKTNPQEALTIIALMQACFEQPEYNGKTFGIISLLGDDQVKHIGRIIEQKLDLRDINEHNVLWGNSAHFQGDERDVIFLSLVDSNTGQGPLNLLGFGAGDSFRKRYNVAASRAKDQLWVVDSLDPANDLKSGDLRKTLIEYSLNPKAFDNSVIEKKSESPFEAEVATALSGKGYHIVQQWPVGSYRLDIVAVCGEQKVAIECDGERWHSGEEKIRQDMERQTILERIGWRFIRIRGSEFYSNKAKTIERVISELKGFEIYPESTEVCEDCSRETELLKRVKARAAEILNDWGGIPQKYNTDAVIAAALNPKAIMPDNKPETPPKYSRTTAAKETKKQKSGSSSIEQKTLFGSPAPQKATATKYDQFVQDAVALGFEVIYNKTKSDVIWVIINKDKKSLAKQIKSKYHCQFIPEKSGVDVTNNRPAWWVKFC